jgi:hypothetical protein
VSEVGFAGDRPHSDVDNKVFGVQIELEGSQGNSILRRDGGHRVEEEAVMFDSR